MIQLNFERHDRFFIQIINRPPINQGTHSLVLSNQGCQSNEVKIYNSGFDDISYPDEQVIASIVDTKASDFQIVMVDVQRQTNGNDCGLFSIGNAVTVNVKPMVMTVVYFPSPMQSHLVLYNTLPRTFSFVLSVLCLGLNSRDYNNRTPVGTRGLKSRMCPPYPNACRKRRLKWGAVI